jgi:hypothetical protein
MSDPIEQIMFLANCGREKAEAAYARHGDILKATEEAFLTIDAPGQKYMPERPAVNNQLTPEQMERCLKGRDLMDKLSADQTSAYHRANQQAEKVSQASQTLKDQ